MTGPNPMVLVPITVVAMSAENVAAVERYRARVNRPGWREVARGKRQDVVDGAQGVIEAAEKGAKRG